MSFNAGNRVNVIKCGDKEETVTDFIRNHVSTLSINPNCNNARSISILCLARSPSSPVARALTNLNNELTELGISVRVIFSQISHDSECTSWTNVGPNVTFSRDIRLVDRSELHDAHEMLVLDFETSWVGDCLRREPAKNDAYEFYAPDCTLSAGCASVSFERLWQMCSPVIAHRADRAEIVPSGKPVNPSLTVVDPVVLDEANSDTRPMSATRH